MRSPPAQDSPGVYVRVTHTRAWATHQSLQISSQMPQRPPTLPSSPPAGPASLIHSQGQQQTSCVYVSHLPGDVCTQDQDLEPLNTMGAHDGILGPCGQAEVDRT